MAQAERDANQIPTLLGVLNTDGKTIIRIEATPSTHSLNVSDSTMGSDNGPAKYALRDQNQVTTLLAVSSATRTVNGVNYIAGITPVAVYADSSGNLLVDSI